MSETELDCSRVRDLLEAHFEGTLPAGQQRQVATHLQRCPACADQRRQIARISAALAAVPRADPGLGLLRAISARAAVLPAPRALTAGWIRLGWIAAACVAVVAALDWALPLICQRSPAMVIPALAWVKSAAVGAAPWVASAVHAARVVLTVGEEIARALGLAGAAAAPTLGLYAAAELALIAVVVLVLRGVRSKAYPRLTGIVV